MCFSPQASFIAAAVLIVIGVITIRINKKKMFQLLALFPLLFGVQQFFEGLVWIGLLNNNPELTAFSTRMFLLFALVVWPILSPSALLKVEKHDLRKKILMLFLGLSIIWGVIMLQSMSFNGFTSAIEGNHISYTVKGELAYNLFGDGLYSILIFLPFFVTHIKSLWILASIFFVGEIVSAVFFTQFFASTWCFFAAIASLYIYYYIKKYCCRAVE